MTTNPSPPQGSEEFDCDEIERELKEITPYPWKWEAEDHSLCSLRNEENSLLHHVMSAWRCDSCGHSDKQCLWPNKIDSYFIAQAPSRLAAAVKRIRGLEQKLNDITEKLGSIMKDNYSADPKDWLRSYIQSIRINTKPCSDEELKSITDFFWSQFDKSSDEG